MFLNLFTALILINRALVQLLSGILNILDQKERIKLFRLTFLDVLISALDIAFLGCTVLVINFYVKGNNSFFSKWLPSGWDKNSLTLIAIFFILFAIKNTFAYLVSTAEYRFIYNVATRLSDRNIRQYLKDDYNKFVNIDSSVHIRRISQQPIEFSNYILSNLQQIISQSLLVFFTICAILFYHTSLFLLLFVLLMPAVILLGWVLKRQLRQVRQNIKKTNAETLKNLREALSGYIESNIYDKDDFFAKRYHDQQQLMNQYICTQQTLQALPARLIEIFAIFGFFILIAVNKWLAHSAGIDLLTIGVFLVAAYKIIPGMVKILNSAGQMKTYEFTIHDLLSVSNRKVNAGEQDDHIHSIKLENIHFGYNGHPVLNGACLDISSGDFIGISAGSGRGKTTLMHILLGFMEPEKGEVRINHRISKVSDRQNYLHRISYIKQQSFLIHDTVKNNITLQDRGYNEKKLKEVISFCGIDILLEKYPEKENLIITENGKNLSGGQRQRIMLARALYHDFDLLIMDEPFGELDHSSENDILTRLQLLAGQGKMILFITHNKAGLSYCNKIISLDD